MMFDSNPSVMMSIDSDNGNSLPLEILMDHVCPFLDRATWNNVAMTCHDMYFGLTLSGRVDPSWPSQAHIPLDDKNIKSLSFAPDGRTMAFVTTDNKNTIHVLDQKWGLRSQLLHAKTKKINPIHQISFAPKPCKEGNDNKDEQEHNLVITSPFAKIQYLSVPVQESANLSLLSKYSTENKDNDDSMMMMMMSSHSSIGQGEQNQELPQPSHDASMDPLFAMFGGQGMGMELGLCAWSPDGSYLASANYDNAIRLWQGDSAINVYHCHTIGPFYGLQFSSNGKYLGVAIQGSIELWQNWKTSSAHLLPFRTNQQGEDAFSFCFSPNEKYLAMGTSMGTIYVWDLQSRQEVQVISLKTHSEQENKSVAVHALLFDPNNDNVLLSGSNDGYIRQWNNIVNDPSNAYCVKEMQVSAPVRSLSFAPNKRTLVSAIDCSGIRFWDYAQWQTTSTSSTSFSLMED